MQMNMGTYSTFQGRLISSVFIIVTAVILVLTAFVTYFEKNRYRKTELNRIYYETLSIKKRLGQLMFGSNWRHLKITLENAKAANPLMLYFILSDTNGKILVSDDDTLIGKTSFDKVAITDIDNPLFESSDVALMDDMPSRFLIHQSEPVRDRHGDTLLRAARGEMIFDTFWDITYMGEKMGELRVGFSGKRVKKYLVFLISGMLCTGFFVLLITLTLIFRAVKKHVRPLNDFILKLSDLHTTEGAGSLRQRLDTIHLDEQASELEEIKSLKRAFSKIKNVFILNWDQLEAHRRHLETRVEERTRELNNLNRKLTRQIEERKAIETRLINSQKLEAISTLAGGIAHGFNNLFMAVTGYASLIQKQSGPNHPNTLKAEKIRALVENGSHSIKQLLGFARVGKYASGPMCINDAVRTSLELFKRSRKDISLVIRFEKDIWNIHADRSQMEQIIMNLVLNASESMSGNGEITVETRNVRFAEKMIDLEKTVSGKFVQVQVQDQGTGIKEEDIPRIFDPFFTTKPVSEGSGLGLSSVYGVVDNHGGFTTVESTEGKGSVFSIFLPAI